MNICICKQSPERERERNSSPYNLFGEKQISLDYLHNNI